MGNPNGKTVLHPGTDICGTEDAITNLRIGTRDVPGSRNAISHLIILSLIVGWIWRVPFNRRGIEAKFPKREYGNERSIRQLLNTWERSVSTIMILGSHEVTIHYLTGERVQIFQNFFGSMGQ
ncbi:hypothetical protein DFH09DRAFT_1099568 [Mycena vulgaris]|nr:hypothetical protein DFH09DRAFT_1099568 [Mycena vulgaris]